MNISEIKDSAIKYAIEIINLINFIICNKEQLEELGFVKKDKTDIYYHKHVTDDTYVYVSLYKLVPSYYNNGYALYERSAEVSFNKSEESIMYKHKKSVSYDYIKKIIDLNEDELFLLDVESIDNEELWWMIVFSYFTKYAKHSFFYSPKGIEVIKKLINELHDQ